MKFVAPESLAQGPIQAVAADPSNHPSTEFSLFQEIRLRLPCDCRIDPTNNTAPSSSCPWVELPTFRVHGFNWTLSCYQGLTGSVDFVSIQMKLLEPSPLPSKLRGKFEFAVAELPSSKKTLSAAALTVDKTWGLTKFVTREALRDCALRCEGGRITIIARISISKAHLRPTPFRPQLKCWSQSILDEILTHGAPSTRTVTFVVGAEAPSTLHLPTHLCEQRLPQLVALLQTDEDATQQEPIRIDGLIESMSMETFRMFLSIAVAGITPDTTKAIEQYPVRLLDLADRFGFVELKVYLESHLAEYHVVDVETGLYFLAIAHARNCILLKEFCMDYLNSPHIFPHAVQSKQWAEVVEAAPELHSDMYSHLGMNQSDAPSPPIVMSKLYNDLEQRNLDLDGTRQQIEERLKQA